MLRLGTKLASRLMKGPAISKEMKLIAQSLSATNFNLVDTGVTYFYPQLEIMSLDYKSVRYFGSEPSHTKLTMPALSPTMTQGAIVKWLKKVGDLVDVGEVIADVETDKATVGFEMQEKGYLAKILVEEGSTIIPVGKLVAILVEDQNDVKAFENYQAKDSNQPQPSKDSKPTEETKKVEKPKAETSHKESSHSHEGDHGRHHAHKVSIQFKYVKTKEGAPRRDSGSKSEGSGPHTGRIFASPLAKRFAREKNIPLDQIKGSGSNGRIRLHDVESYKPPAKTEKAGTKPGVAFPSGTSYIDVPVTAERKAAGQRYLQSKNQIPHYYLTTEVIVDNLLSAKKEINAGESVEISINDIIIKAAGLALRDVPEVNSQWHGDVIQTFRDADIGVAVDTGNSHQTPVIRAANRKTLSEISAEAKDLASRAKSNQLGKEEIQGATFTISNLGILGVVKFAPIINSPQAAILGVGTTRTKYTTDEKGNLKAISVMYVTLSCDHRVVDGAVGAKWLLAFKNYIEKPTKMLL